MTLYGWALLDYLHFIPVKFYWNLQNDTLQSRDPIQLHAKKKPVSETSLSWKIFMVGSEVSDVQCGRPGPDNITKFPLNFVTTVYVTRPDFFRIGCNHVWSNHKQCLTCCRHMTIFNQDYIYHSYKTVFCVCV